MSDPMKESRLVLRSVQEHLQHAHISLGASQETIGVVEVLHHPSSTLANLNYVTPRRNMAWVSGKQIEQGLNHLNNLGRKPRVQYIEGLYPPQFATELRSLGLSAERETPIMAYKPEGFNAVAPPPLDSEPDLAGVTVTRVEDQTGIHLWWYVWRNAYYDVLTLGVEPLIVGRDMAAFKLGNQIDLIAYRGAFPVGVARLSMQDTTAHVLGIAILREARTPEMLRLIHVHALKAALERKCALVFAPGESEQERRLCRDIGYVDFSSIVCYSAQKPDAHEEPDEILGQSILSL